MGSAVVARELYFAGWEVVAYRLICFRTWDLPGPGIYTVSLALPGRLSTTEPLGKPCFSAPRPPKQQRILQFSSTNWVSRNLIYFIHKLFISADSTDWGLYPIRLPSLSMPARNDILRDRLNVYLLLYHKHLLYFRCCLVAKSCPTLFETPWTVCSPTDSSVHGISQARILEWVPISFSRGSFIPRDWTHVPCIGKWVLYHWLTREDCILYLTIAYMELEF